MKKSKYVEIYIYIQMNLLLNLSRFGKLDTKITHLFHQIKNKLCKNFVQLQRINFHNCLKRNNFCANILWNDNEHASQ